MKQIPINSRAFITLILITVLSITTCGCFSVRELKSGNKIPEKVYMIETSDGRVIDFQESRNGYALVVGKEIVNINQDGKEERYALSDAKKVYVKKFSVLKTVGMTAGVTAAAAVTLFVFANLLLWPLLK